MHGHLNVKFKLFKNHNRMQGVGTGGGVKDGKVKCALGCGSEICYQVLGGGIFVMYRCVNVHYHKLCAEKK